MKRGRLISLNAQHPSLTLVGDGKPGPNGSTFCWTLGRSARCDLSLQHPLLSKFHCELLLGEAGWAVHDTSRHGVWVNRGGTVRELAAADRTSYAVGVEGEFDAKRAALFDDFNAICATNQVDLGMEAAEATARAEAIEAANAAMERGVAALTAWRDKSLAPQAVYPLRHGDELALTPPPSGRRGQYSTTFISFVFDDWSFAAGGAQRAAGGANPLSAGAHGAEAMKARLSAVGALPRGLENAREMGASVPGVVAPPRTREDGPLLDWTPRSTGLGRPKQPRTAAVAAAAASARARRPQTSGGGRGGGGGGGGAAAAGGAQQQQQQQQQQRPGSSRSASARHPTTPLDMMRAKTEDNASMLSREVELVHAGAGVIADRRDHCRDALERALSGTVRPNERFAKTLYRRRWGEEVAQLAPLSWFDIDERFRLDPAEQARFGGLCSSGAEGEALRRRAARMAAAHIASARLRAERERTLLKELRANAPAWAARGRRMWLWNPFVTEKIATKYQAFEVEGFEIDGKKPWFFAGEFAKVGRLTFPDDDPGACKASLARLEASLQERGSFIDDVNVLARRLEQRNEALRRRQMQEQLVALTARNRRGSRRR